MTPELKKACEIVFQEHKSSPAPIAWNKNPFNGRISLGLREMARETLLQKKVIYLPKEKKKDITSLNPATHGADSFEEAIELAVLGVKMPATVGNKVEPVVVEEKLSKPEPQHSTYIYRPSQDSHPQISTAIGAKWYLRPVYYYVVWPVCAIIGGALIAYLLGSLVTII